MPFTLAHPAIMLPLPKLLGRHAVFSALAIGSMMPDAPYFLALDIDRGDTHSLYGLLWFSLPLGLLFYGLFHTLIKRPLAFVLPPELGARLPLSPMLDADKHLWALPLSVWLGSFSHIVWDSCTHKYGFFVERLPLLKTLLFRFGGYNFWLYKVLQYVSGVLGVAILLLAAWWWLRRAAPASPPPTWPWPEGWRRRVRLALFLLPSSAAILAAATSAEFLEFSLLLRHMVIIGGRCFLLTVAMYTLTWWASERFVAARRVRHE